MFDPASLREPIVQAPLAGGASTPELAIAVCEAGGLGFIASGYKRAEAVREEIARVRAGTDAPFGLNIFVPRSARPDPETLGAYLDELAPEAKRLGAVLGEPCHDDDDWEAKLELAREERVALVSFTFGCPEHAIVERLHAAGIAVWVTVTSREEGQAAFTAGADALVAQGIEAGGHRGGFDDGDGGLGLLALLRVLASAVQLPLIGTGGIADGEAVAAVLCAGAAAAAVGSALMLTPDAGTASAQRVLMGQPNPTALTRAFSGRLARGIVNRFMTEHTEHAPLAYPEVHHATSPLRAAARSKGDAEAFNLWAGQAHELARALPAGQIVRQMGLDARRVAGEIAARLANDSSSGAAELGA